MDINEGGIAQHATCVVKSNPDSKKDREDINLGYTEGIYLFGGRNEFAEANNNQLVLKVNENPMRFIKMNCKAKPPNPRFGHTMSFLPNKNFLAIFGGCGTSYSPSYGDQWTISVEKLVWCQVTINGNLPERRTNHSMVSDQDNLIIVGGINETGFLSSEIHVIALFDRNNKRKLDGVTGFFFYKSKILDQLL